MNFEINVNNLTREEQDELNRLVEKSKKKKAWKPKEGDKVFVITSLGTVEDYDYHTCSYYLEQAYSHGNAFRTIEEARDVRDKRQIEAMLKRFAEEHNEKIDWNTSSEKWYLTYDCDSRCITPLCACRFKENAIYFLSNEIAEKAIEEIGEGAIRFWLGVYDEEYKD